MKKYIVALLGTLMLSLSFTAHAEVNCDQQVRNVSDDAVKNSMLIACMKANEEAAKAKGGAKEAAVNLLEDPDKLERVASSYATAIGLIARDLGVAANEFIKTDAGKLATYAIIWTVFGDDVRSMAMFPISIILIMVFWHTAVRFVSPPMFKEDENGKVTKVRKAWTDMDDTEAGWVVGFSLAAFALLIITMWS